MKRPRDESGLVEHEVEEMMRDLPEDVSAEELREFLEADRLDVEADPLFRERLRRKLWALVRERFGSESGGGEPEPGSSSRDLDGDPDSPEAGKD